MQTIVRRHNLRENWISVPPFWILRPSRLCHELGRLKYEAEWFEFETEPEWGKFEDGTEWGRF